MCQLAHHRHLAQTCFLPVRPSALMLSPLVRLAMTDSVKIAASASASAAQSGSKMTDSEKIAASASASAAQPGSKRSKPSTNPPGGASGSAAQPATLLEQVEQLGHYPKRFKTATTDKERAENSLAKKISKHWSKLDDETKAKLTRLQQSGSATDSTRARRPSAEHASRHILCCFKQLWQR